MSHDIAYSQATPMSAPSRNQLQFRERLTCTVREACSATGIGKTKMHELISDGAVESAKIGRQRLVKVRSLLRLVDQDSEQIEAQP